MTPEEWVKTHGSGTLQRSLEFGTAWRGFYLAERTAFEFGHGFEPRYGAAFTSGQLKAEGDCPAITETLWYARALNFRWRASGMAAQPRYIRLPTGEEGAGLVVSGVLPPWLGERIPVALVALAGPDGRYLKPMNPC